MYRPLVELKLDHSEQEMRIQFNISSSSLEANKIRYLSSLKNKYIIWRPFKKAAANPRSLPWQQCRATCVCVESRSEASSSPIIMLVRLERDMSQLAG